MSWIGGKRYAPASIGDLVCGKRGEKVGPRIAIGPEWSAGRSECPRKLLYPMSGFVVKGERGRPPLAIGPEWSAGRRECPRKLMYPMSWPEGEGVVPSQSL